MNKLETLVVPEELGAWMEDRGLGNSEAYFTMIEALFNYWGTRTGSPTGSFIAKNKKELIEVIIGNREYEVEEPLYYALVKGHELITDEGDWTYKYWNFDTANGGVFPSSRFTEYGKFLIEMSKSEWNELGIDDSNADFVKVGEELN